MRLAFTLVKTPAVSNGKRSAFTLVELLVVVTIIVLLLALLAPAMDKAIYQAELAVCASRLDAIGTGAQLYAINHSRWYPDRKAAGWPNQLSSAARAPDGSNNAATGGADDRAMFRPTMPLNRSLMCPLAGNVDLEQDVTDSVGRIPSRYSSYLMWFGFYYQNLPTGSEKAMRRLGDRLTYRGDSFNIVAMDMDVVVEAQPRAFASHPDADGVMARLLIDNQMWDNPVVAAGTTNAFYAQSWWDSRQINTKRGVLDNNYLYQDGSVARINGVAFADYDRGMAMLPLHYTDGQPFRIQVPTR